MLVALQLVSRHFLTPAPSPCINQVDEVKLLGVYLTNTFSSTAHFNHLLTIGNQRLFLLSQLKNQGLALDSLHIVYQAIIQSKIIYALPAFAGQLTAMDIRVKIGGGCGGWTPTGKQITPTVNAREKARGVGF